MSNERARRSAGFLAEFTHSNQTDQREKEVVTEAWKSVALE